MSEKIFTTFEVSKLLNVDITTVMSWVNRGQLEAYRTPGGHRRIEYKNLLAFLEKYKMPIPPELKRGGPQILLVDDDPHFLRIVTRLVNKILPSAVVKVAKDGFETGAILESFFPDLILLDLMMPNMDGFRVCENIREKKKFAKVKIIAVSGFASEASRKKILSLGANKFLEKTGSLAELQETILKFLPSSPSSPKK